MENPHNKKHVRSRTLLGAGLLALLGTLVLRNLSMLAPMPPQRWRWLAHRGVHQTFDLEGIDDETCTARRIRPLSHQFLENTIPSMKAAFETGAARVELDIHVSADGVPAVFHDATLDCRTDGTGTPESRTWAELKRLDLGHGYSADGGRTFPLRGAGVGLMPSLDDLLAAFPGRSFLIHFKTDRASDGDVVADRLARLDPEERARMWVYGGAKPCARLAARLPAVRTFDRPQLKTCLVRYLLTGWLGYVPESCRHTVVLVPINHAGKLWGWPRRFESRLREAGSEVMLLGPTHRYISGIDDETMLARVPPDFGGMVWTNRIELLGGRR